MKHSFLRLTAALVVMSISLYLQYKILQRVDASELMWFLYCVNIPFIIIMRLIEDEKK